MKVLIACEESQEVCKAFRSLGHEAYSCDVQEPSGGHPEWHILGDAVPALRGGQIVTMDDKAHYIDTGKMKIFPSGKTGCSTTINTRRMGRHERKTSKIQPRNLKTI